ncbi:MAG: hypothetical protein EOO38_30330, partial [Cytophagaceae bacterium]
MSKLNFSSGTLSIDNLDLSGIEGLTELPDGLCVRYYLYLNGCINLTHLPRDLTVGYGCNLLGCSSLTHLPEDMDAGHELFTAGLTRLTGLGNHMRYGGDGTMFRALLKEQQQRGRGPLHDLHFCQAADNALSKVDESGQVDLLRIVQKLSIATKDRNYFCDTLQALAGMPHHERAGVAEIAMPLLRHANGNINDKFANMLTEIYLAPAAQRPARVQALLVELREVVHARGTSVHEGVRDT